MTPFNIAFLFCRLLSIWCIVRFVEVFGQVAFTVVSFLIVGGRATNASPLEIISYVTWPMGLVLVSCVLWIGAPIIARSVAQIEYSNDSMLEKTTHDWWNIGRGLLGLGFVMRGAAAFMGALLTLFTGGNAVPFQWQSRGNLASAVIEVILGALLLLFARRAMKHEAVARNSTLTPNQN